MRAELAVLTGIYCPPSKIATGLVLYPASSAMSYLKPPDAITSGGHLSYFFGEPMLRYPVLARVR